MLWINDYTQIISSGVITYPSLNGGLESEKSILCGYDQPFLYTTAIGI